MCIRTIVDASAFRHFCAKTPKSAGDQLRKWIERGDGIVVYSAAHTSYANELKKYKEVLKLLSSYFESGKARDIDTADFSDALDQIPDPSIRKSDDLALAVASEATILVSCDSKLQHDFKMLGKVRRQPRRSMPDLLDNNPEDTMHASRRKKSVQSSGVHSLHNTKQCTIVLIMITSAT